LDVRALVALVALLLVALGALLRSARIGLRGEYDPAEAHSPILHIILICIDDDATERCAIIRIALLAGWKTELQRTHPASMR
jgi:hypothetical protein